jgi:hypothetical protein
MNAQVFKSEALSRLAVRLPAAVPVMAKVDIDKIVQVVKVRSSTDEFYIVEKIQKANMKSLFMFGLCTNRVLF